MDILVDTEQVEDKDVEVPREIDFQYVHIVFQNRFQTIDQTKRAALTQTDTIQTIRFLLNEYTLSRLIHYDRLNAFLLDIPSISDICSETKINGTLLQILSDEDQVEEFNRCKDELFSPVVAQSALFLLKEVLKHPLKRTRVLNDQFSPIRNLLHEFVDKVNPHKKENFKLYYHSSNLKNIALFLKRNPDLDITQVFPLFYENDEFYIEYTDWLEMIQDRTNLMYDERQALIGETLEEGKKQESIRSNFSLQKHNHRLLKDFLNVYLQDPKIPTEIERDICNFLPKILHLDLICEIIKFYEIHLPSCFPEHSEVREKLIGGITVFKSILVDFDDHHDCPIENFITMGYLEFWSKLKRLSVPEQMIDDFILDVNSFPQYSKKYSYDVFWKKPFLRIKLGNSSGEKTVKKSSDNVYFSYVQVLDAFFYFLSSNIKSHVLAGSRGRGFEELVAERIIKELDIKPKKIIVHNPKKTDTDEIFKKLIQQNKLITPSGKLIRVCIAAPDLESSKTELKLGEDFRWREIDLTFVYKNVLYIIECKNHLLCDFVDFEPIILKRNLNAYRTTYAKRRLCEDVRVKRSLNILNVEHYDKVRFVIVTGEECPFEFMLSYNQFGGILRNFEKVHQKLEETGKKHIPKTVLFAKETEVSHWFEDIGDDLAMEKLHSDSMKTYQKRLVSGEVLEPLSISSETTNKISKDFLAKGISRRIAENLSRGKEMDPSNFDVFFTHKNPDLELIIHPIIQNPVKLRNFLMTVFHSSLRYNDLGENPFTIPASVLKYCLAVDEKYFGIKQMQIFLNILRKTIIKMFRNIIVGGRGAGRFYKVDNVENLKGLMANFDTYFAQWKIQSPNLEVLKAEVEDFLSKNDYFLTKKEQIMNLLNGI